MAFRPTQLGRYEIIEELGKGAMGIVFLARDPLIGRLLALKTFRVGLSVGDRELEQFRARFIREAQSAGILSHPGIVTVHDVVERSEEGLAFIAMEYVKGTNLKSLLQGDAPLELAFVADVVSQVADALDYAHAHGVVHRDIKPANIILTPEGRVKITDFGIARLNTSNLTQEGQLLGTPNYMSPEQIQGKDVDHRADLFALGVMLYEMITGHKPFHGENLTAVSHKIVFEPFTPPERYIKDLPAGLRTVLDRALEKDLELRYQRAKDLAADLEIALSERKLDLNDTQNVLGGASVLGAAPQGLRPPSEVTIARPVLGAAADPLLGSPQIPAALQTAVGTPTAVATPTAIEIPAAPALPVLPELPELPEPAKSTDFLVQSEAATLGSPSPAELGPTSAAASREPSVGSVPAVPQSRAARGPIGRPARLVGLAALAAFSTAALAAFVLLALAWSGSPLSRSTAADTAGEVVALRQEGRLRLAAGDAIGAVAAFRGAEQLAPDRPRLSVLRERAEKQAQAFAAAAGVGSNVEDGLEAARAAIAGGRWDEAGLAAIGVLAKDPSNTAARELLAQVDREKLRASRPTMVRRTRPSEPAPVPDRAATVFQERPAEPAPVVVPISSTARLEVRFSSQVPKGVVMLYAGRERLLREQFKYSRGAVGGFERSLTLDAGEVDLRLYVTPSGKPAVVKTISGNFAGGSSRRLTIDVAAGGTLTFRLE